MIDLLKIANICDIKFMEDLDMNKPSLRFHGNTETKERLIERVAAKLEMRLTVKRVAGAPSPLLDGEKFEAYMSEQNRLTTERTKEILAFCERAKVADSFVAALNILSERITLIDADRVYRRMNGAWSK